jgi:hypothetical protein
MNTLLNRLAAWDGYEHIKHALQKRGLSLPLRYQQIIIEKAECPDASAVHEYWRECANEHVRSAGRTKTEGRLFPIPNIYRSPFLDRLADLLTEQGLILHKPPFFPLLPCLRQFEKRCQGSTELAFEVAHLTEAARLREAALKPYHSRERIDTKRQVLELLLEIGRENGMEVDRRRWLFAWRHEWLVARRSHGIVLRMTLDTGGRPSANGIYPDIAVSHLDEPSFVFSVSSYDVCPGFHCYRTFNSRDEAALGARAHVVLALAFLDTL